MRKFFKSLAAVLIVCFPPVRAQQLPDPHFEDWSGAQFASTAQPKYWNFSNVSQLGVDKNFAHQATGRSGKALKIQDQFVGVGSIGATSPGYVALGHPWAYVSSLTSTNDATAGTYGGISWTHRPDSMVVWIKRYYDGSVDQAAGDHIKDEHFHLLYYAWSGTSQGESYKAKNLSCTNLSSAAPQYCVDEESDIRLALDGNECGTPKTQAKQIAEGWFYQKKAYNSWTRIVVPIYYLNDDQPTKCNVILSAGRYPDFRANTGQYAGAIELNAIQRANPEMQKRVANVIRAMSEGEDNPIVSIHDHGAGGHLNSLSELVEETGGHIDMSALPVGDPTLSAKEIIGNESQERMGLVVESKDVDRLRQVAERERAPFYVVGETTGDDRFVFEQADGVRPIDLGMKDMFGSSPKTVMTDVTVQRSYRPARTRVQDLNEYVATVLQLEAVACKDWLTNKVDRSVTGRIARQQCQGEIQLPLSDCGVVALDYTGTSGIATSLGHAPQAGLIDSASGSVLSIAEALTNLVGANLKDGLKSVSLSANWMWPCRNEGEDARLYRAVKACSDFACSLGINIPTGKDSLSMTQKYGKKKILAPGTVIISAAGEVSDVKKTVSPVLQNKKSYLYYIDFSCSELELGGSALYQSLGMVGDKAPAVADADQFATTFDIMQDLVAEGLLLAAHDVSAGGLVTTLLEMTFANVNGGMTINLDGFAERDLIKILFAENPALVIQVASNKCGRVERIMAESGVKFIALGEPCDERTIMIERDGKNYLLGIDYLRDLWYKSSYLLDCKQSGNKHAKARYENYKKQPLRLRLPKGFTGRAADLGITGSQHKPSGIKAAIIREKGVNGDREMAYSLYYAGFDVKDVHMTDLMSGRETLDDVQMIVFCGGFSNSDVLGSAKGWASGFVWNNRARKALERFYQRNDTLSLGICNGCQVMIELNLINPEYKSRPVMAHNDSHKFESAFVNVTIPDNQSVMLGSLSGSRLGIWVAHGEGKFELPEGADAYNVVAQYSYKSYPGNPNGSPRGIAGLVSSDGRHLAMMPHLERATFPWQCAWYPESRRMDEVTPWIEAFVNARRWCEEHQKD